MLMQFLLDDARLTNSCSYIHCLRSGFSFVAEAADNDNEAGIDGLDDANSYGGGNGGAYADPRCEMKKRQQQEIVVSGLTINTSDISSGEELAGTAMTTAAAATTSEDNGFATMTEQQTAAALLPTSDYSILSPATNNGGACINDGKDDGKMMPDQSGILMSRLIEPSVRKIGGGGAVSMSAFQVSTLHYYLLLYSILLHCSSTELLCLALLQFSRTAYHAAASTFLPGKQRLLMHCTHLSGMVRKEGLLQSLQGNPPGTEVLTPPLPCLLHPSNMQTRQRQSQRPTGR